jgi:hypothetical protein
MLFGVDERSTLAEAGCNGSNELSESIDEEPNVKINGTVI